MSRKNDDDRMRLTLIVDFVAYEELRYIKDLKGHGAKPREIIRLMLLGLEQQKQIDNALKASGLTTTKSAATMTHMPARDARVDTIVDNRQHVDYEVRQDDIKDGHLRQDPSVTDEDKQVDLRTKSAEPDEPDFTRDQAVAQQQEQVSRKAFDAKGNNDVNLGDILA